MAESGINLREHFVKQRRNLILISLFAIFYKAGGLKLEEINILGNVTTLERPEVVSVGLIAFFVYFLWRYYSVCHESGGISELWHSYLYTVRLFDWYHIRYRIAKRLQLDPRDFSVSRNSVTDRYGQDTGVESYAISISPSLLQEKKELLEKIGKPKLDIFSLFYVRIKAIYPCFFKSSTFSEYVVPYILAGLAAVELAGFGATEWFMSLVK